MTYQESKKFKNINDKVIEILKEHGYNTFYNSEERIKEMLFSAKIYNKKNNSLLKNEYYDDNVYSFDCKCLKTDKLINCSLKPKKENTIKKLFVYEVLKSQYATKDMFSYFKHNEL